MTSLRLRKVVRDLWLHRGRTALAVVAIAVGVAGSGGVLNTWSLVRIATTREFEASRPPTAILRTDGVTQGALAAARAVPGVVMVESRASTPIAFTR